MLIPIVAILVGPSVNMNSIYGQGQGPDWISICNAVQSALYKSCSAYVNPDNTLTYEGEGAVKCIKNGAVIGGGASALGVHWAS